MRSAIVRAPMIRLVVPFIIGLLLSRWSHPPVPIVAGAATLSFLIWVAVAPRVRVRRRWARGLLLYATLCALGMAWERVRDPAGSPTDLSSHAHELAAVHVGIAEVISTSDRSVRAWADVDAGITGAEVLPLKGTILLTLMRDSTTMPPAVGDELLVVSKLDTIDRIPDPGGFDLRQWAASYGAVHQAFAPVDRWQRTSKAGFWSGFFDSARERISVWLKRSALDERERGLVKAILLGIRDELDQDQKQAFARSGTMHVLAVSGSHVAIIYGALFIGLSRLGDKRRWRITRALLILLVLWFYAGLTGFTPSVLRATLTFTLFCLADMTHWRTDPINSLAASAFLLLLWDPRMLTQLSFQLSFLAVLGIAFFYRPIHQLWAPSSWIMRYAWSLFAVSMAAQAFTTPLSLLTFKAFPVWFIPANLVIVGLVSIGVYGGTALLVFHAVPWLGDAITWAMSMLLKVLGWSSDLFATLPGAYPDVRVGIGQCLGLYALVLASSAWVLEGWRSARSATLLVTITLLFSWALNARQRNAQRQFVIYDERDKLTCAVQNGRALAVFTDSMDEWTARKVEQHRRSVGAVIVRDTAAVPEKIGVGPEHLLLIDAGFKPGASPDTGFTAIVLKSDGWYDLDALWAAYHPPEGFVLSPTMSSGRRSFVRKWGAQHAVTVFDVRSRGAYVR